MGILDFIKGAWHDVAEIPGKVGDDFESIFEGPGGVVGILVAGGVVFVGMPGNIVAVTVAGYIAGEITASG